MQRIMVSARVCQSQDVPTNCSQLPADLDKLVLLAQKWQMKFHVDKCKVMHVGMMAVPNAGPDK